MDVQCRDRTFYLGLLKKAAVQTGCIEAPESGTNIIFIEKRISYPASLQHASHVSISRSDIQCFSHEDGCFAPETKFKSSLSELLLS